MSALLQLSRWAAPGILALAVAVAIYAISSAPGRKSVSLGVRGLVRTRSMQRYVVWRMLEPSVRWLGVRVTALLNDELRATLDREIVLSGDLLGLLPEELVALVGLLSTCGFITGVGVALNGDRGLLLCGALGALLGAVIPYLAVTSIQDERRTRVRDGLPSVIDLLSLALSAGIDFPSAIRQVVSKASNPNDPLIEEFNVILYELSVGKTRKDALLTMANRIPIECVRDFVAAVTQAEERGTPLDEVLRIQAQASRERRSVSAEEAAARASAKMFAPIMIIFCVVMLLILGPLVLGLEQTLLQE